MLRDLMKGIMLKFGALKLLSDLNIAAFAGKVLRQPKPIDKKRKLISRKFVHSAAYQRTEELHEDVKNSDSCEKDMSAEDKPDIFKILNINENDDECATFQIKNDFKVHRLDECPARNVTIRRCDAVQMYYEMQVIRAMEQAASAMYREKIIRGFLHLYIGQEAIAVGMNTVLRPQDNVITAYRCHGWCYVTGTPVEDILAELAGKSTGVQRGKGGSMHMYNPAFYGGNGIVGGQVPLGVGISLASQYKNDGGVCVMCYGDGAANQGQIFESFNMASLWKLPCIFACENNQYGMGTSSKRSSCCDDFYTRGDYIPGIWVDGMDILAVCSATQFAIDYVLKNGPIILEMHTYRYQGHSMSDPGTSYRKREEIEEVRKKDDPIKNFKQQLLDSKFLTNEQFELIKKETKREIDEAIAYAKTSTEVDVSELSADVYSQNLEPKIRGIYDWSLEHKQISKGKSVPEEC